MTFDQSMVDKRQRHLFKILQNLCNWSKFDRTLKIGLNLKKITIGRNPANKLIIGQNLTKSIIHRDLKSD